MTAAAPRIAVILPCYNEEAAIAQTIAGFRRALPDAAIYVYDNNSADRTVEVARAADAEGVDPKVYAVRELKARNLELSCHDPDDPKNWPRNMFIWRSNLLGSSGKGHEYFLKHLLGASHGVQGTREALASSSSEGRQPSCAARAAGNNGLDLGGGLFLSMDFRDGSSGPFRTMTGPSNPLCALWKSSSFASLCAFATQKSAVLAEC